MVTVAGPQNAMLQLSILFSRFALGFYFAFAGWGKIRGEFATGVGSFYRGGFKAMQPAWLPDAFAAPYGYALPWIEFVLGVMLMLGIFGTVVALLIALVMLSILVAQLVAGQLFVFQSAYKSPGPYHGNVIYLALALLLTVLGPGRYSVDALWRERPAPKAD